MKYLSVIILLALSGCSTMSPSTKIFQVAQGVDSKGNPRAVSLKVFDSQADFYGATVIQTPGVRISAAEGINHSTAVRYHWAGFAAAGRAIIQPLIWGPVAGAAVGSAIGAGSQFIPK